MADGYLVDLVAMETAVEGVQQALDAVVTTPVRELRVTASVVGHEGLADALGGFLDRWDGGLRYLTGDAEEVVARLRGTAATYRAVEDRNVTAIEAILQGEGPDPGAVG